ncbi:MAG: hypothetical protein KJP00_14120 [Bacteroidia bacterium]|nr:hypothetical protein [Bacteroidia bacterium]
MYKYILEQAENINWMALFALITFFIVFGIGVYLALRKDSAEIDRISDLPLADDDPIIQ